MPPKQPVRRLAIVFLAAAVLMVLPFIAGELRFAANPEMFDPNMRILYYFFRFYDPQLFPHDYTADYALKLWTPPGFLALHYLWAKIADPLILERALPPLIWLGSAPLVFCAAKRLGGITNAWVTLAIYLVSSVFPYRLAAGMEHSFAFFFLWWTLAALLGGRPKSLALCTIISAAVYPAVTPVAGLTLALWLLFPRIAPALPRSAPLLRKTFARRFLFLAIAGCLTLLPMAPMVYGNLHHDYGRMIQAFKENEAFPESGPQGRNMVIASREPLNYLLLMYFQQHSVRLGIAGGQIISLLALGVLLAGILLHDARDRRPGKLNPFIYATALLFFVFLFLDYESAYRFLIYPVPVLIALFLPLALRRISKAFPAGMRANVFVLLALGYMFCIAVPQPGASGYPYELQPWQKSALAFVRTLPKDTMIAGWPGDQAGNILEEIPYFARRQALVTWEGHATAHVNYVLTLRARMNAVVDAYLAHDTAPLIALRDTFHVDYLIVNEEDLTGSEPPKYCEPFDTRARKLWEEGKGKPFILPSLVKTAGVYSRDGIDIIDLHKL